MDELTDREKTRLMKVRDRGLAELSLNCETFEMIVDEFWEDVSGVGMYLHFRGIDGRLYQGCMLPGDVERLRVALNQRSASR